MAVLPKMQFLSITRQLTSQLPWNLHAVKSNSSAMQIHHLQSPVLKGYKTSKPIDLSPTKITRKGLAIDGGFPLILGPAEYFSNFAFVLAGSSPQGTGLFSLAASSIPKSW